MKSETMIFLDNDGINLNWETNNAKAILMQSMMDETLRLRKSPIHRKERQEIRQFLLRAYETILMHDSDIKGQEPYSGCMQGINPPTNIRPSGRHEE